MIKIKMKSILLVLLVIGAVAAYGIGGGGGGGQGRGHGQGGGRGGGGGGYGRGGGGRGRRGAGCWRWRAAVAVCKEDMSLAAAASLRTAHQDCRKEAGWQPRHERRAIDALVDAAADLADLRAKLTRHFEDAAAQRQQRHQQVMGCVRDRVADDTAAKEGLACVEEELAQKPWEPKAEVDRIVERVKGRFDA